jgi:putative DNA primase/helicase
LSPSNGKVHPSGRCYELLRGGFATIPVLTPEEREQLWSVARTFDVTDPPAADPAEAKATKRGRDDWQDLVSPWDDYNGRARWEDLLPDWANVFREGETEYLRRPGKDRGVSATVNRNGSGRLYVFSTSTEFEAEKPYTKFAAYALLEHGGDFREATNAGPGRALPGVPRPSARYNRSLLD